jgi:hypothetical protein
MEVSGQFAVVSMMVFSSARFREYRPRKGEKRPWNMVLAPAMGGGGLWAPMTKV